MNFNSRSRLDNRPPPVFKHLIYKPKTMQLIEGKYTRLKTYLVLQQRGIPKLRSKTDA